MRTAGKWRYRKYQQLKKIRRRGVLAAIEKLDISLETVDTFVHGTTLGINAFLEREGATTGIITNDGFSDVFEIGRYVRPKEDMYTILTKSRNHSSNAVTGTGFRVGSMQTGTRSNHSARRGFERQQRR
jgi:N-methylhydantoinase A/oxoprolinase/acetone carboxylase beta subunit